MKTGDQLMTTLSGERQIATASYIADLLTELRTMGQQINADFLVYLIEMAIHEAESVKNGCMSPGRKSTPIQNMPKSLSAEQLASLYMTGKLES